MALENNQPRTTRVNYATCPKGHRVFVIWSEEHQLFGFTCDECKQSSPHALTQNGMIEVVLIRDPEQVSIEKLHEAIEHIEKLYPLRRCHHGNALMDHAGEKLEPSCGCRC